MKMTALLVTLPVSKLTNAAYLQDKNAVWVLRFTGKRGSLDTVRNLTDQIARSFRAP
jgi:hypothetical protein